MESPVFEEFDPAGDCDCPGCVHWRRVLPHSPAGRLLGHPAANRTPAVAAAAFSGVSAGDGRAAAQGPRVSPHGPGGRAALVERARKWVDEKVPHGLSSCRSDDHRRDCPGYVSMTWGPPGKERTVSPGKHPGKITGDEPGPPVPAPPFAPSSHGVPGYPGRALLRPGADNVHVARLGRRLVEKGFGRYFTREPGPRWSEEHRRAVRALQRAQGWRGGAADGHPGPETWRRLFS